MKTDKSNTKRELPDLVLLDKAVKATALYLSQWTETQIKDLSIKQKSPYIWPIDNVGYIIGHYRVLNNKGSWQVRDFDNNLVHCFTEKLSAIFYVLCELTQRYRLSSQLKLADSSVDRLKNNVMHYEISIKNARARKDYEKLDIWRARLYDAHILLRNANEELQKSLNRAKYIKYWE